MNKLLIVEDEPLARHVIKTLVLDNFEDIQVVAEAETGRQAVSLTRKYEPNIILMDIRIPGINGIEASKSIMNEFPHTKILILSAYDDFNYIQQALNIGVKGYLLKPLEDESVIHKITELIEQIKNTHENDNINKKIENSINVVKPFIQKELVASFISGHTDAAEVRNYILFIGEEIEAGYFMLISYDSDSTNHVYDNIRKKIIKEKVYNVALKYMPTMKKCLFGRTMGNTFVLFFPINSNFIIHNISKEALEAAKEIKRKINVIAGVDVSIGLGTPYKGIENFRLSYMEAYEALKKAMPSIGIVLYKQDMEQNYHRSFEYPVKMESEMLENIRMGQIDKAKQMAEQIISHVFGNCNDSLVIKDSMGQLITIIKRTLQQMGVSKKALNILGILMETGSINDMNELLVWCKSNIMILIDQAEDKKRRKDPVVMEKVITYVNTNFSKDITLDSIAEEVGLSPQYISRLFKENFGENFVDYFTKKRIEFAKKLLLDGNKRIGEIGMQVGYGDANYFCRVFKKITGLTPKQYRMNYLK